MKIRIHRKALAIWALAALAAFVWGFAHGFRAAAQEPVSQVAVTGVDVLPMTGEGQVLRGQDVLIEGERIAAIGPSGSIDLGTAQRIDGRGKVLMPGLVDMHVHFSPAPGAPGDPAARAAATMLAHGVTTARSMAGNEAHIALREAIERGAIPGPRTYLGAPALHDQNTPTPDAGRAAVRAAKAAGFDFIKSHQLTDADVWQAVRDEARAQGLATAGHVTNTVGLERAAGGGQQIEHLDGFAAALLPAGAPERAVEFGQIPPPPILEQIDNAGIAGNPLFARLGRDKVWQVPTLSLFELLIDPSLSIAELRARPEMRYVPQAAVDQWAAQREQLVSQITPEYFAQVRDFRRAVVAALAKAGVPIMTGSDTAQAFHVWGPALHREIEALAEVLGPYAALDAATAAPARYLASLPDNGSALGWKPDFGTIAKGQRADLILVEGNPLADLGALHRPDMVIAGGRAYDRATLDRMLDGVAAAANPQGQVAAAAAPPIYVMRHLPAGTGDDPGLSDEGRALGIRLAETLGKERVAAIFATDTRRARETAAVLAAPLGLAPRLYDPARPDDLIEAARKAAGPVLIVAHSNTAPDIARRLGADPQQAERLAQFGAIGVGSGRTWRAISLTQPSASAAKQARACPADLPADARCGALLVAENRADPGSRKIPVVWAVLPATGAASDDPLVVIPGGPGLGAVQSGAGIAQLFAGYRANRDILLFDQRGTGGSNRLACDNIINSGNLFDSLQEMPDDAAAGCRDALSENADLAHYTTRETVLDMEALRQELGYERLDLFGMSYGTRPALDYLRMFPDQTGEVIIRAAAPADMTLPLWSPQDTQASFDRLAALCAAQSACASRHDMAGDLAKLLARLDQGPMHVSVKDPRTMETVEADIDRDGFGQVMFFMQYIPELAEYLPPLLELGAQGNLSPLVQAVAPVLTGVVGEVAWGLRWSVICDEDVRRIDHAGIDAAVAGTFMGRAQVDADIEACAAWPRAAVPADYFAPVRSDREVLIISGAFDPIAGERWGNLVAATLPNALHVTSPSASHLPPLPGCTDRLAHQFLDGASLASLDAGCVSRDPPPRLKVAGALSAG